jgi:hypothetical protein
VSLSQATPAHSLSLFPSTFNETQQPKTTYQIIYISLVNCLWTYKKILFNLIVFLTMLYEFIGCSLYTYKMNSISIQSKMDNFNMTLFRRVVNPYDSSYFRDMDINF